MQAVRVWSLWKQEKKKKEKEKKTLVNWDKNNNMNSA